MDKREYDLCGAQSLFSGPHKAYWLPTKANHLLINLRASSARHASFGSITGTRKLRVKDLHRSPNKPAISQLPVPSGD
eukprot:scaffold784_cov399-Prasinococcus_capsulatus_cf.AAC.3